MKSKFADVGFYIQEENIEEEMRTIIHDNFENAAEIEYDGGKYLVVPIDNLIELWFPFEDAKPVYRRPSIHYQTATYAEIGNIHRRKKEEDILCAQIYGRWRIDINIPAPKLLHGIRRDIRYKCQLAVFALDIQIFRDMEDFCRTYPIKAAEEKTDSKNTQCTYNMNPPVLSSKQNIPIQVKDIQKRTNSFTEKSYYILKGRTFQGTLQVLVSEETFQKGIRNGSILYGKFLISGKILPLFFGQELIARRRIREGCDAIETLGDLYRVLRHTWSEETAEPVCRGQWSRVDRTCGQGLVTALLVYSMFGGSIRRVYIGENAHYFNEIGGKYVDLTSEQFELFYIPVDYSRNFNVDARSCIRSPQTRRRYRLLVRNISDFLAAREKRKKHLPSAGTDDGQFLPWM